MLRLIILNFVYIVVILHNLLSTIPVNLTVNNALIMHVYACLTGAKHWSLGFPGCIEKDKEKCTD